MRPPYCHLRGVPVLLLLWAALLVGFCGCSSEETEASIVFMTGGDTSSSQRSDDLGRGQDEMGGRPVCPVEKVRCHDNAVWSCADGLWSVTIDCGQLGCVDGACVCLPDCETKVCGTDGCGGLCGTCDVGDTCDEATGVCVPGPEPQVFTAVYVEDIWGGSCSSYLSSGSDIRGAALYDLAGELVGYWEEVVGDPGTEGCQNSYTDAAVVLGEPTGAQLALQGGWVIGTFEGKNAIGPGWSFSVYEYDGSMGGSSETYAVWLATDLDCVKANDPKHDCMVPVSEEGFGTTTFKVGE